MFFLLLAIRSAKNLIDHKIKNYRQGTILIITNTKNKVGHGIKSLGHVVDQVLFMWFVILTINELSSSSVELYS